MLLAFVTQAGLRCEGHSGSGEWGVFYVTEAGLLAHTSSSVPGSQVCVRAVFVCLSLSFRFH